MIGEAMTYTPNVSVRVGGRLKWALSLTLLVLLASVALAGGPTNNQCDMPGESPDVIVGSLHAKAKWGTVGDVTAFSVGTTSCNVGTCWLDWFQHPNTLHPVIGQNLFRLKDGRFEHFGQSWLKHGFFALSQGLCFNDCMGTSGTHLGVHCSDPYSAGLNADQSELGPKYDVNAGDGTHPNPVSQQGGSGDAIWKRLQAPHEYIDPALNAGALYFVEGQYISADDTAAENDSNNASYRKIIFFGSNGNFDFSFDGATVQEIPAIRAWETFDSGVEIDDVDIPNDGRMIVGSKVTDLGDGIWHYEYAIQNLTSHRSMSKFTVPIPSTATITNIGFHDVDYHSGEFVDGKDWIDDGGAGNSVHWETQTQDVLETTNALRWGTLYNFRFDADVPPDTGIVTLGLFRPADPGDPPHMLVQTQTPDLCDSDGTCDAGEDSCNCSEDCGPPPQSEAVCDDLIDNDCDFSVDCADQDCCGNATCPPSGDGDNDGVLACADCDDGDAGVWLPPSQVENVMLSRDESGVTHLNWDPPVEKGAINVLYEALRARNAEDFVNFTQCMADDDPVDTTLEDPGDPIAGGYFYLIRATNACPAGFNSGSLGTDSNGVPRAGRTCP